MEDLKAINRQSRGQVTKNEINQYEKTSVNEIKALLSHPDSRKRTIAATLAGRKKMIELIPQLCNSLATEESLYPRIACSEALGNMGLPAVYLLIGLLGKIGTNQEKSLPTKYFAKKSYPLVRDLAARTLVKISTPALPELTAQVQSGDSFETQQAIDAIGGITAKTKGQSSLSILLQALNDYKTNEITIWKIVRALSAFKSVTILEPLIEILTNNPNPPIRWEAARSLGQAGILTPEVIVALQKALQDEDNEVKKAAKTALSTL